MTTFGARDGIPIPTIRIIILCLILLTIRTYRIRADFARAIVTAVFFVIRVCTVALLSICVVILLRVIVQVVGIRITIISKLIFRFDWVRETFIIVVIIKVFVVGIMFFIEGIVLVSAVIVIAIVVVPKLILVRIRIVVIF